MKGQKVSRTVSTDWNNDEGELKGQQRALPCSCPFYSALIHLDSWTSGGSDVWRGIGKRTAPCRCERGWREAKLSKCKTQIQTVELESSPTALPPSDLIQWVSFTLMNLLKQPLLAGDSGSGRIRKVAAEDQREARRYEEEQEEEEVCDAQTVRDEHKHPGVKSTSSTSEMRLMLFSITHASLCIHLHPSFYFCSPRYHFSIKSNFERASRSRRRNAAKIR